MKWITIVASGIAAIVFVVVAIGALLPKRHLARARATFHQPPATVWQTITDFAAWPRWNRSIQRMERVADRDGHAVWLMVDRHGQMRSEILEETAPWSERGGRLVTRIVDDGLPFGGSWTWEVVPDAAGCMVAITEDGEIRNPVFRFMARFVFGYSKTAESFLQALDGHFRGGAQ
jgi:hypothetical protein